MKTRALARSPRQTIVGSTTAAALAFGAAGAAFFAAPSAAPASRQRQIPKSSASTRQATDLFTNEFHERATGADIMAQSSLYCIDRNSSALLRTTANSSCRGCLAVSEVRSASPAI